MKPSTIGIIGAMLGGLGHQVPNSVREVEEDYQYDVFILQEYELIKQKKSRLSRNKRDIIESKALRILARQKHSK